MKAVTNNENNTAKKPEQEAYLPKGEKLQMNYEKFSVFNPQQLMINDLITGDQRAYLVNNVSHFELSKGKQEPVEFFNGEFYKPTKVEENFQGDYFVPYDVAIHFSDGKVENLLAVYLPVNSINMKGELSYQMFNPGQFFNNR